MFAGARAPSEGDTEARAARLSRRIIARSGALGVAFSASVLLAACAPAFDGRVYHGQGYSFEVPPPPSAWRPIDVTGSAVAFETDGASATILVGGRCDRDGEDVPLRSLVQHLFLQFTDRTIHDERVEPFDEREAMRVELSAKLDGVERRFVAWVLKKDGCVYDVLLASEPGEFASIQPDFDAWARGFHARPREMRR
jgi:hypothetical protein